MSVEDAYRNGKKAYDEGMDVNHIPGCYTSVEEENFVVGYYDRANEVVSDQFLLSDDIYELEDISMSNVDDDHNYSYDMFDCDD